MVGVCKSCGKEVWNRDDCPFCGGEIDKNDTLWLDVFCR